VAPSHSNVQTVITNMHSLDEQERKKGSVARRTCWALCSLEQVGQATAVLEKRMVFGVGYANLTANNARQFQLLVLTPRPATSTIVALPCEVPEIHQLRCSHRRCASFLLGCLVILLFGSFTLTLRSQRLCQRLHILPSLSVVLAPRKSHLVRGQTHTCCNAVEECHSILRLTPIEY
jgi:hypothetical protein